MTADIIAIIITAIVLPISIALAANFAKKRKASNPSAQAEADEMPMMDEQQLKELLEKTGVQLTAVDKNDYAFNYQGGAFLFSYKPSIAAADLIYPNFDTITYQDVNIAAVSANSMNMKYGGWTCYLTANTQGEKEKSLNANMSYRVSMLGKEQEIVTMLHTVMQAVFSIARAFSDEFEKGKRQKDDLNMSYLSYDFENKVLFIRNKLQVGHGKLQEEEQFKEGELTIGSLLKLYEGVDMSSVQSLRIVKGNHMERVENINSILAFDLQEHIKQTASHEELTNLVALLNLEKDNFIFDFSLVKGGTDKSLYYTMTIERTGDGTLQHPGPHTKQCLVEIRLTSANDDYWEAKYMIDEAQDKLKEGRYGDLTDTQQGILSVSDPNIQTDLYWGKKYYLGHCYYQSLNYFKRVHRYFCNHWASLSDEKKGLYYEVCFYIGFIYMEMNQREKAFYFLYTAKNANNTDSAQEFINCLCNMDDPFAADCIQSYLEKANEILADDDENEIMIEFRRFLTRRLAYALISRKDWDEAESLLNRMIKNEEDVEFAKEELAYLKHIREAAKQS